MSSKKIDVQESQPKLSDEEYAELAGLKSKQISMKETGYDLQEFLLEGEKQVETARERLTNLKTELAEITEELQTKFHSLVVAPYGFTKPVTVSDTSPHYIVENNTTVN